MRTISRLKINNSQDAVFRVYFLRFFLRTILFLGEPPWVAKIRSRKGNNICNSYGIVTKQENEAPSAVSSMNASLGSRFTTSYIVPTILQGRPEWNLLLTEMDLKTIYKSRVMANDVGWVLERAALGFNLSFYLCGCGCF